MKIVMNGPVKFPDKKGRIVRKKFGDVISKPSRKQLEWAEKNHTVCKIVKPAKKKSAADKAEGSKS